MLETILRDRVEKTELRTIPELANGIREHHGEVLRELCVIET